MGSVQDVRNNISKKIENALKKAADVAEEDLERAFVEGAIQDFYDSYSPVEYIRGYNLYTGYEKKNEVTPTSMSAGIKVGSEFVDGPIRNCQSAYRDSVDSVFGQSFEKGIHGQTHIFVSAPPQRIMDFYLADEKDKIMKLLRKEING